MLEPGNTVFGFADLDGDGDTDFTWMPDDGNVFLWEENTNGIGGFGPPRMIAQGAGSASARSPKIGDIDLDGDPDFYTRWYGNR